MRIKLDENLPSSLAAELIELGHHADTVVQEGLDGATDAEVLDAAIANDRFLVTQDLDFSDVRKFQPGRHPGILIVRLREPGSQVLSHRIRLVFGGENVESWSGCFVAATEKKVRVRRPTDQS